MPERYLHRLIASSAFLLPVAPAMAQSTIPDQPLEVARAALTAYDARAWHKVAELTHPDAIASKRASTITFAKVWESNPPWSDQEDLAIPKEVADYFREAFAEMAAPHGNPILRDFPGIDDVEQLENLPAEEFLARFLAGHANSEQSMEARPPLPVREVIGAVTAGDSLVYVVYSIRHAGEHEPFENVDVLTVRRSPEGWRIMLNRDLGRAGGIRVISSTDER
jgi:hypothetical protein